MGHANGLSAYRQGFFAPQRGKSLADCPHPVGSEAWREWRQGWKEVINCPDYDGEGPDNSPNQRSPTKREFAS